jgi:hypothetical protein
MGRQVELWGCGYNQFHQIDETGKNVYGPKLIATLPCLDAENVVFHWAGWADVLCTLLLLSPFTCCLSPFTNPSLKNTLVDGLIADNRFISRFRGFE